jgi:two-component system sensor histidine kinase GlrK
LLLTGSLLVALPLVGALAYSVWSTERLAERSRNAVYNASQAARASRTLVNRVSSIERLARQIIVLADAKLRADFVHAHLDFLRIADELLALPLDAEHLDALKRATAGEQALLQLLNAAPRTRARRVEVNERAARLAEEAYEVLAVGSKVAEREVERLRASAETVRRRLILLGISGTAVALALAFVLGTLIVRPVRELDASIRQLGGADFARPIRVRGPRDLEYLGERLDWLRRRLTELEAQRTRFVRYLSHELKTPLAALREGVELLNDRVPGPLTERQTRVVSIVRENSVKLQDMIEELLDYQRALHAAAALDLGPVALDSLVREAAAAHELALKAKAQRLVLDLAPLTIEADRPKLRSILDNLVGNAVKFTPNGGTISVRAKEDAAEAIIEVIDSGPGVPQTERETIFDSFFRGRAKSSGRVQGSGLGLAIAREFAEAHGGRIAAVASTGGGHFRVALPRRPLAALASAT